MRGPSVIVAAILLLASGIVCGQAPEQPKWYSAGTSGDHAGWGLKLGYRLNQGWSLEGGYHGFGVIAPGFASGPPLAPPVGEPFAAGVRRRAWSFAGVEIPRPMGRWSSIGAGATYQFSPRWHGRLGWDRYSRAGDEYGAGRDVDVYGLGIGWRW